jgi:uncharacterized OB-fold protein
MPDEPVDPEPLPEPVHPGLFNDAGLIGGSCGACGRRHFPSATPCPWCGSDDVTTVQLSSEGTLWGWTAVTAAPPGYSGDVPYGFGVVTLPADGLQVVTRLVEASPAALHEGDAVRFTVVPLSPGTVTWAFTVSRAPA